MTEKKFKYSLILRATEDKRLQYITARRLGELWPDQSFAAVEGKSGERRNHHPYTYR